MNADIHLLDVVALTEDILDRGLRRGQVGTVVEMLAPGVFEVEFVDNDGRWDQSAGSGGAIGESPL
jgi:hypothetical protein